SSPQRAPLSNSLPQAGERTNEKGNLQSLRAVALRLAGEGHVVGEFQALGGPCEVLLDISAWEHPDREAAYHFVKLAAAEAWRIESKFSRYNTSGVVHQINNAKGQPVVLDEESSALLDFADSCHRLSDGAFDITSGVLRRAWNFDGSNRLPKPAAVAALLPLVGWHRVSWNRPQLRLPPGMEIDLGGIGKEYAVDQAARQLAAAGVQSALVNFGGDIFALGPRANGEPWVVGIDDPNATGQACVRAVPLRRNGLATSGDARRFLKKNGKRYGHILNPKTGWPVQGAPRSVSVKADSCIDAGMLATFAMLKGPDAEAFLEAEDVEHFIIW
ncbi:MAG: FAD:protein FMN transferase, partial [Gallionella sp.]|nr:FAD:protein FMN transferase [Gallionella sp.]